LAEVLLELNPRIAVLPNTIPEKLLQLLPGKHSGFVIGWQGAQQHIADLQLIYNPVLRFMLQHSDVEFHLWGPSRFDLEMPGPLQDRIICHPWTSSVWEHYLRLNMDVGLAPIDVGDRFNETKSDVKLREYAALGIPFIASRSKAYDMTAGAARGMIADSEEEWFDALTELYRNQGLRHWMQEQGRLRARLWTTEANSQEWERAYERARHTRNLRESPTIEFTPDPYYFSGNGDRTTETVETRERL
jgi:glycosyltransferase involved in cell wall biosynthesis